MKSLSLKSALRTALGLACVMVIAAPAMAVPPHDDREWRDHARHARDWHRPHPVVVESAPVVYAPPAVVYEPPPSPGLNLIIPLNLR